MSIYRKFFFLTSTHNTHNHNSLKNKTFVFFCKDFFLFFSLLLMYTFIGMLWIKLSLSLYSRVFFSKKIRKMARFAHVSRNFLLRFSPLLFLYSHTHRAALLLKETERFFLFLFHGKFSGFLMHLKIFSTFNFSL